MANLRETRGTHMHDTDLYELALRLASRVHCHQMRKGCDIPYITHLVAVSRILEQYGFGVEIRVAGLLHDIVEDQDYPLSAIRDQFGGWVAEMVAANSECKMDASGCKRPLWP